MTCFNPRILYANAPNRGMLLAKSRGDGYAIEIKWVQGYSGNPAFEIAYNIYYSTIREDVFTEGVKVVATTPTGTEGVIKGLTPGQMYFFAARGTLHDPNEVSLSGLPTDADGYCKIYPEAMLLADITATDLEIPVSDVSTFPPFGIVQIGGELIAYTNLDLGGGNLVLSSLARRGFYGTEARQHGTDGYDGYTFRDPLVKFFKGFEDGNVSVRLEENKFEYPNHARTDADGYRIQTDKVTTDLSSSEQDQIGFPPFDYAGWKRTDPVALLSGDCVGSYYGGEHFCADGYNGVGQRVRGIPIDDSNNQREEFLLTLTGEPVMLVRRLWEGITCRCVSSSRETPEHRCPKCFGTGFITGYEQFFSERRSDGRILVRFDPAVEDLLPMDAGIESDYKPNSWGLSTPIIKDRDFLIRFNKDGTEEFRYEVLNVTRNKILLNNVGRQGMTLNRVRKTDPIYQWRAFRNTATMPMSLTTGIGMVPGPGGIVPHVHSIVINEGVLALVQVNQTTNVAQGHNHPIVNGIVQEVLGHTHNIVLP